MQQRMPYIDKLKGVAMLLVVMGHTIYFCMYHEQRTADPLLNIICTFHVPLFFFLSGFVVSTVPSPAKFLRKAYRFMMPMLIVGFINALLIDRVRDFFLNDGHNGYWYLLTLTFFYLLLLPFHAVSRLKGLVGFIADSALSLAIWLMLIFLMRIEDNVFLSALNIWGAFAYWPFFVIGFLCRKYSILSLVPDRSFVIAIPMITYLVLLVSFFQRIDSLPILLDFFIAFIAIASLVLLFRKTSLNNSFIDRQLILIGNNTLSIYIYHYFFIRFIDLSLLTGENILVELLITSTHTLAVTYATIGIGTMIDRLLQHIKSIIVLLILLSVSVNSWADKYDNNNYQPANTNIVLDKTNLPIVFIDTRCGADTTKIIHKDYRIAVRMKIINNIDRINYGDTLAHPHQIVDYEGWVAIRYRGNTSFNYSDKKPYNFKTIKTADVNGEKQKTTLLGMPKDNTWVLLAPYGDRSLLRDVLVFQLAQPYFDYTPRCRYCEVVLDGIYYGIFVLAENIRKGKNRLNLDDPGLDGDALTGGYQLQIDRDEEPHFTSKHLAVDSLGRTYKAYNKIFFQFKHPDYEDMLPEQIEYIQQRVNLMENVLASDDFTNPETGYCQYMDVMSFIDQQLSQEFSGNVDGYRLSTNIYKHRDSQDARFKTALWDFNLAFGNSNAANAVATDFWRYQNSYLTNYNAYNKVPFWWMRLMEDRSYVMKLKERWAQYRQENYSTEHIIAAIDSITTLLRQDNALERNNNAWKMFKNSTYDMEIDRLKTWILKRLNWMDEQLEYVSEQSSVMIPSGSFKGEIVGYYNLNGERLTTPQKGIVIIRRKDGTTSKLFVK